MDMVYLEKRMDGMVGERMRAVNGLYLMPMDELPRWAYTDEEWDRMNDEVVEVIRGVRYVYDERKNDSMRKNRAIGEMLSGLDI